MGKSNTEKDDDSYLYLWGKLAVLVIVLLWWINLAALVLFEDTVRGTFGDMFGAVNSLFSGLALAGIIFTILLQRKELGYQREELKATRQEFITQNNTLKLQRFENTFFNLLNVHHQIVDSIDLDIARGNNSAMDNDYNKTDFLTLKGRDVFKYRYEKLVSHLKKSRKDLNLSYLEFYERVQTDFGHYFRNLYRIIKMVNETEFHSHEEMEPNTIDNYDDLNYKTRYKYISIVRSQLSDYELLWIFYNCLSENGNEKFKPLVEEYTLLKNMSHDKFHDNAITNSYKNTAFEKKEILQTPKQQKI